jgi:hypothetical protein
MTELSDASAYTFDELKQILEITSDPVHEHEVEAAVQHYLDNYEVNDKIVRFLKDAERRMVSEIKHEKHSAIVEIEHETYDDELILKKDVRNPKLGKVIHRLLIIDSQYAEYEGFNTDFICYLTETVNNCLAFSLYAYTIPYSYYNIDPNLHNDKFVVDLNSLQTEVTITIPPSSYTTVDSFMKAFNDAVQVAGFVHEDDKPFIRFNEATSRVTLDFYGSIYNGDTFVDSSSIIVFFRTDHASKKLCNVPHASNVTLGILMGFLKSEYSIHPDGHSAESHIDLSFSQYYIINIDDFSQHQMKTSVLGINPSNKSDFFMLPSFFLNNSGQMTCHARKLKATTDEGVKDNYPRSLTKNQLYATNELLQHNVSVPNYMLPNPLVDNSFAVIPIKKQNNKTFGEVAVEIGGTLQDNKRIYTGPTNLTKLRVTLMDDLGNIVNLNGVDWSIILKLEIWADQHEV